MTHCCSCLFGIKTKLGKLLNGKKKVFHSYLLIQFVGKPNSQLKHLTFLLLTLTNLDMNEKSVSDKR